MPRFSRAAYLRETFGCNDPRAFRLCGMDEVGRGAYAGPLVAAAVVLPPRFRHPLLRDSKLLSPKQREQVAEVVRRDAEWLVAAISVREINDRGLGWANREIFRVLALGIEADGYCSDGNLKIPGDRLVHTLVRGDNLLPAISAASIVAKVHRDAHMRVLHEDAPIYNWASNKGYGAREHRMAIREHGAHREHRNVFLRTLLQMEMTLDPVDRGPTAAAAR